ncbi:MAG: hypothetical protein UX07_C0023G0015 [Parcubacteria group bacterium GW2011_GWA2_45_30]|nr:MAG: hypothetical protein UX07_C0023G0015 [Parcubacteria group bacterium GW2011_GWA2_45_30]
MRNAIKVIKYILLFLVLWWGLAASPILVLEVILAIKLGIPLAIVYAVPPLLSLVLVVTPIFIKKKDDSPLKQVLSLTVWILTVVVIIMGIISAIVIPFSLNAPR